MHYKLKPPGDRGPCYYMRGTYAGRRFEVSTGETTREAATLWAIDYAAKLVGDSVPGKDEPVTFARAAAAFVAFKNPQDQDRNRIGLLIEHFAETLCSDIAHAHLVAAADAISPGLAPASRNRNVMGPAAAVLHYAADQGWCAYRRFKLFKVPKRSTRKPAADADLALLIQQAKTLPQKLMLALLYETGLRVTDILKLKWGRVDLSESVIWVKIHKTDDLARLPISPIVVTMAATLPGERKEELPVLPWHNRWQVYRWLKPLCLKLGIVYTPHMSRHALASWAQQQRIPDNRATELGAWSDPRSLRRYQHVDPSDIVDRKVDTMLQIEGRKAGGTK